VIGPGDTTVWVLLRAAGIGSYLMLFLSVAGGLVATTAPFGRRVAKASAAAFHQAAGTVGLVLLAVHLGGLLVHRHVRFDPLDLVVPLRAGYRPVALALGIGAMDAAVVVTAASYLRRRIGAARWRKTHLLAVPAFTAALLHGLFAGTDTVRPAMWWTYVATGAVVVFLLLVRGLAARADARGPAREDPRPAREGPCRPRGSAAPVRRGSSPTTFPAGVTRTP
jgi:cytochrome b561